MKQKFQAYRRRLSRYSKCIQQKQQNQFFHDHEAKFYKHINKSSNIITRAMSEAKSLKEYWTSLWSKPKDLIENAECIRRGKIERTGHKLTSKKYQWKRSWQHWRKQVIGRIQEATIFIPSGTRNFAIYTETCETLQHPEETPTILTKGLTHLLLKSDRTRDL